MRISWIVVLLGIASIGLPVHAQTESEVPAETISVSQAPEVSRSEGFFSNVRTSFNIGRTTLDGLDRIEVPKGEGFNFGFRVELYKLVGFGMDLQQMQLRNAVNISQVMNEQESRYATTGLTPYFSANVIESSISKVNLQGAITVGALVLGAQRGWHYPVDESFIGISGDAIYEKLGARIDIRSNYTYGTMTSLSVVNYH